MTTWVFAEESESAPTPGSLELVSKAATMGPVTVFYVGAGSPESFSTLADYGATTVHHLDPGDALPAAPAAKALAALLDGADAGVVLFGREIPIVTLRACSRRASALPSSQTHSM